MKLSDEELAGYVSGWSAELRDLVGKPKLVRLGDLLDAFEAEGYRVRRLSPEVEDVLGQIHTGDITVEPEEDR